MRYQLLVYPTLFIFAAWAVLALWEKVSPRRESLGEVRDHRRAAGWRILAVMLGVGVLAATAMYAFAFTGIYLRPITVAASRWIYQHIPARSTCRSSRMDRYITSRFRCPITT
jgi:membrane-anchored protein YejM (alkaline phosphatase superfamily)